MKLKLSAALIAIVTVAASLTGAPAAFASGLTQVHVSVPNNIAAGVNNPIDVSICQLSSLSSKTCAWPNKYRVVTLFVNGASVGTKKFSRTYATFSWKPRRPGSYKIVAKVTAGEGYSAGSTEQVKVKVSSGLKASSLQPVNCTSKCKSWPATVSITNGYTEYQYGLVGNSSLRKGTTIALQYLDTKETWSTDSRALAKWLPSFSQYGARLYFNAGFDTYCPNGDDDYYWTYRMVMYSNKRVAQAVTDAQSIHFVCYDSSGSGSSGTTTEPDLTSDAGDQQVDTSAGDTLADINVDVTDPDSVGYTVKTVYCYGTNCDQYSPWYTIDSADSIGDDSFILSSDWGQGLGDYTLGVVLVPDDGSPDIWQSYTNYISIY